MNQDKSQDTALTSSVMNVMNSDTSSWTALRVPPSGMPAQHHKAHRNHHNRLALGTIGKTEKEETGPDHSLDTANIIAPAIMTCTEATLDHNDETGTAAIKTGSR